MDAGPLLTVSGERGRACLPSEGATMRVHPPACPDGGRSCRGPSPGSGGRDCPHSAVLTVASLPWAGPAQPYFLITSLAGPWEPPRQAGAQGSVGSQTRGSRGGSGGHGWKRGSRVHGGGGRLRGQGSSLQVSRCGCREISPAGPGAAPEGKGCLRAQDASLLSRWGPRTRS